MQVIDAMLRISGSEFQPALIAEAKDARKLPADYCLADDAANNRPRALRQVFEREDLAPYFLEYPLGTDLTAVEQQLVPALEWLQINTARTASKARVLAAAIFSGGTDQHREAIDRLGLGAASGISDRLLRRLVRHALTRTTK